ncbi:hypothetical protein AJ80_08308 [Polytolypa hystricis UAMH7299]|uniref:MHYT domain-containing protein n=1 Tax=Polytolypa hystricis (strain UAMH7299) TaxID=1447883 RepID=A0A2B7X956_POLH7|nr:hypothetical protein AJ80_08308 [Polytolypa hystricis UAMH7299]
MAPNGLFNESDHAISASYNPGLIVLSYFVSFIGCVTTLELLHRRTARFGLYNWYLLVTSAISMGGIGIWCMHFIGNRAIILQDGTHHLQISYSSTFTAVSFFLPIAVLTVAFYFIGISERADIVYIIIAGSLTGAAVCGMHYVGQLGIANYYCTYKVPFVVGSAIIAVVASIASLGYFFRMRAAWMNSWWKRLASALVLGLAVSGMHWAAAVGTIYKYKGVDLQQPGGLSTMETVIICSVLSCFACVFLVVLAVIARWQQNRSAKRVHQLVLACAYFDSSGRVMVSPEGQLPIQKIANHYVEKTFADEEFSQTHPAFIWAFRATRNWPAVKELIPGMKIQLASSDSTRRYFPGIGSLADRDDDVEQDTQFDFIFKQLFCVAAQELADQIRQPVEKMGELYEDVLVTGVDAHGAHVPKGTNGDAGSTAPNDVESVSTANFMGKGQLMFMVRRLNKVESASLSAVGFRFAAPPHIATAMSRRIQVPLDNLLHRLEQMKDYSPSTNIMQPGIHIVGFSLLPSVQGGFDVLVRKEASNLLPHVKLPIDNISSWQQNILSRMDDWSLTLCLRWLQDGGGYNERHAKGFCELMHQAISKLSALIDDQAFGQARFSARQIKVPCSGPNPDTTANCKVYSFRIVNDLQSRNTSPHVRYASLGFFNTQQQVYPGVQDHDIFQETLLDEFAHCANLGAPKPFSSGPSSVGSSRPTSSRGAFWRFTKSDLSKTLSQGNTPLVDRSGGSQLGGIVVSNEVTIDVAEVDRQGPYPSFEMQDFETTVEVGDAGKPHTTYVEDLCAMCHGMSDFGSPRF